MIWNFWRSKKLAAGSLVAGTALFVFAFQNCSKVKLQKVEEPSVQRVMPGLELKSHICPQARITEGQPGKFVFIVDLSASNFGNWKKVQQGQYTLSYWDPSQATDLAGARFDAVKYFMDNCGNQAGSQFSIIGFSNAAGILSAGRFACDGVKFGTAAQTLADMNALRTRVDSDRTWYEQWSQSTNNHLKQATPDSLIATGTSYTSASQCLEKLITEDLNSPTNQSDNYRVFFISDGIPEDKKGTGCNLTTLSEAEKAKCYIDSNLSSITLTRTAAMSKGKDLRLQGIYYGSSSVLPDVLNALSQEGGTCVDPSNAKNCAVKLSSFSSNPNALCNLVVNQSGVGYQPDVYMAVNLTMRYERGVLVADSDMDGISDVREASLGFDPQNPRSSGVDDVLDGVCERLGGYDACLARRNQVVCSPQNYDKLGLSDCDIKMLGLDAIQGVIDQGTDSDRDGIPDFIEIVKGTDPSRSDASQDADGDHVTNRDEIIRGTDPFYADNDVVSQLLNKSKLSFRSAAVSNVCSDGDWTLSVDQLQTIQTLSAPSFPAEHAGLAHGKNEQIVAVFYRLTPTNSLKPEIEYYNRYVKVSATGYVGAEVLTANPSELMPADFELIGKTRP